MFNLQNPKRVGYSCLAIGCFLLVTAFYVARPVAHGLFAFAGVLIGFGAAKLMASRRR